MENKTPIELFTQQGQQPAIAEQLFDLLPDIVFFIKDLAGKYVTVNQTLVDRCGAKNKKQVIGLTSAEALGETLGSRYVEQDQKVLQTQQPLIQFLELHNYPSQELGWCLTTKLPIIDADGRCTGLIGVSQDLKWPETNHTMFSKIHNAIQYMEAHLETAPSIKEMAAMADMSPYQLDRRMKLVFGLTAGKWLLKTRISQASELLLNTEQSILDIAFSVGYSDQSAFTKQFKKVTGFSPLKFKKINHNKIRSSHDNRQTLNQR